MMVDGTAGAAAAAAAMANAVKASGTLVRVEPADFLIILDRQPEVPLVIHATGGFFSTNYQYLTSYKGLTFFTKSPTPLTLPEDVELIKSKAIWMPS